MYFQPWNFFPVKRQKILKPQFFSVKTECDRGTIGKICIKLPKNIIWPENRIFWTNVVDSLSNCRTGWYPGSTLLNYVNIKLGTPRGKIRSFCRPRFPNVQTVFCDVLARDLSICQSRNWQDCQTIAASSYLFEFFFNVAIPIGWILSMYIYALIILLNIYN